jgi:uncharacterized membrane protein SirB2
MYLLLKTIHISAALISISGFILRGLWMMQDSELLQKRVVKILPHIVDTIFPLSGISLLITLDVGLLSQSWLLSKIFLLFVYIFLGVITMRAASKPVQICSFFAAILTFIYIGGIALTKSPASWFI